MSLAIFDLDNTLLKGDSDYAWGQFLVEQGIVDGAEYASENERYYSAYLAGTLDIYAFLRFSLHPLTLYERQQLDYWHRQYMQAKVLPMITAASRELVKRHRRAGDTLMIITATNSFITTPIAREFGIEQLLATEPEIIDDRFTGEVSGIPCFREGKVQRLEAWLAQHGQDLLGSHFYSDSHNDLALLERVEHPVAVNPDEALQRHAADRGWPILDLHQQG